MSLRSSFLALSWLAAPAAWAAHPLITEDTGTQGRGNWQLEFNAERVRAGNDQATVWQATLAYGLVDSVDLQVGIPYVGGAAANGKGDVAVDVKWRFWEREALSFGMMPGITLPTGDDGRGLGAGRATVGALLFASYEQDAWSAHAQAGYRYNENTLGERRDLTQYSASLWLKPLAALSLVGEVGLASARTPQTNAQQRFWTLGAIWSPRKDLDLDVGWRRGEGDLGDRAFGAGLTFRW